MIRKDVDFIFSLQEKREKGIERKGGRHERQRTCPGITASLYVKVERRGAWLDPKTKEKEKRKGEPASVCFKKKRTVPAIKQCTAPGEGERPRFP